MSKLKDALGIFQNAVKRSKDADARNVERDLVWTVDQMTYPILAADALPKLRIVFRESIHCVFHRYPAQTLAICSACIHQLIEVKLVCRPTEEFRSDWETVLLHVLNGILDFLEAHPTDKNKTMVGACLYSILCARYFTNSNALLRMSKTNVRVMVAVYSLLAETVQNHPSNTAKLLQTNLLGPGKLGLALSQSRESLAQEALLQFVAILMPTPKQNRNAFASSIFSDEAFSAAKTLRSLLASITTKNYDIISDQIVAGLASMNIAFPQPFTLNEVDVGGETLTIVNMFIDKTCLTFNIEEDDVVTDINLPLQKAIVTSGPRLPAGRDVLIVFQSPPMRGDVPMLLSAHDSNKIAFKVYANEWDRFEQALSYRNVSIKQQGEKISLSNSQLTLDFDSRGKPFSEKLKQGYAFTSPLLRAKSGPVDEPDETTEFLLGETASHDTGPITTPSDNEIRLVRQSKGKVPIKRIMDSDDEWPTRTVLSRPADEPASARTISTSPTVALEIPHSPVRLSNGAIEDDAKIQNLDNITIAEVLAPKSAKRTRASEPITDNFDQMDAPPAKRTRNVKTTAPAKDADVFPKPNKPAAKRYTRKGKTSSPAPWDQFEEPPSGVPSSPRLKKRTTVMKDKHGKASNPSLIHTKSTRAKTPLKVKEQATDAHNPHNNRRSGRLLNSKNNEVKVEHVDPSGPTPDSDSSVTPSAPKSVKPAKPKKAPWEDIDVTLIGSEEETTVPDPCLEEPQDKPCEVVYTSSFDPQYVDFQMPLKKESSEDTSTSHDHDITMFSIPPSEAADASETAIPVTIQALLMESSDIKVPTIDSRPVLAAEKDTLMPEIYAGNISSNEALIDLTPAQSRRPTTVDIEMNAPIDALPSPQPRSPPIRSPPTRSIMHRGHEDHLKPARISQFRNVLPVTTNFAQIRKPLKPIKSELVPLASPQATSHPNLHQSPYQRLPQVHVTSGIGSRCDNTTSPSVLFPSALSRFARNKNRPSLDHPAIQQPSKTPVLPNSLGRGIREPASACSLRGHQQNKFASTPSRTTKDRVTFAPTPTVRSSLELNSPPHRQSEGKGRHSIDQRHIRENDHDRPKGPHPRQIVDILNDIQELLVERISHQFENVKTGVRVGLEQILEEAAVDLQEMHNERIDHYNKMVDIDAEYTNSLHKVDEALDDALRVGKELRSQLNTVIQMHDRRSLSKKIPVFPAVPAIMLSF